MEIQNTRNYISSAWLVIVQGLCCRWGKRTGGEFGQSNQQEGRAGLCASGCQGAEVRRNLVQRSMEQREEEWLQHHCLLEDESGWVWGALLFEKRERGHSEPIAGLEQRNDRKIFTEKRREGGPQKSCERTRQEVLVPAINSANWNTQLWSFYVLSSTNTTPDRVSTLWIAVCLC